MCFWRNDIWPGNSPDLNAAEQIETIIKNEVERRMLSETKHSRYLEETLLCSYASQLRAVKNAKGHHTDY